MLGSSGPNPTEPRRIPFYWPAFRSYTKNPSKPIANKKVVIKNEFGDIVEETTTNEFGAFAFRAGFGGLDMGGNVLASVAIPHGNAMPRRESPLFQRALVGDEEQVVRIEAAVREERHALRGGPVAGHRLARTSQSREFGTQEIGAQSLGSVCRAGQARE